MLDRAHIKKQNALQAVLRPRRRLNLCCAADCALQWAEGAMLQPGNNLLLPRGTSRSPNQWLTHATKGCLEGGRLYPNRHALSRANWGCLKGTIWTTRRWGRREQGSCRMPDRQRGSIPASPAEPLSTYSARVSRGWRNPRWLSRVGLQALGKITTTNPQWGGRADLRIGGRSSDLLIGN